MDQQESTIHRTWVQMCIEYGFKEAAAIAADTEIRLHDEGTQKYADEDTSKTFWANTILVELLIPVWAYGFVTNESKIKEAMEWAMRTILEGRILCFEGYDESEGMWRTLSKKTEVIQLAYQVQLMQIEEDWRNTVRELIATSSGVRNQGSITELMFKREKKEPLQYNGLKFASQSEIRIAQEFEQRKVLFFPLAVAVRADTGQQYKDHKEVDFLVCHNGAWGILEVSGPGHNGRFAADAEKDAWFKQSGILCIEHRTAEQCYNNPKRIVDEFLTILAKHKK